MLQVQAKSPGRISALIVAVVLALSLIPMAKAHADDLTDYPVTFITKDLIGGTAGSDYNTMNSTRVLIIYITPNDGKPFQAPPKVEVENTKVTSSPTWDDGDGCYYAEVTGATGPVTITVSGGGVPAKYPVALDTSGLKGASASASPATEVVQGASVTVSIQAVQGKEFAAAPTVAATGATAGAVDLKNGVYVCELTNAVGPAVNIVVSGEAKGDPTATLDVSGLKGATAVLDKTFGIKAGDTVVLTVTPEAGKAFSEAPSVVATNATVGQPSEKNGAYAFPLTGFTGDTVVTVTGEAKGSDPVNPDTKGDGAKALGSGEGKADSASGSKLAQTGDPLATTVAGAIGVAALAVIAGAAALRRKHDAE